MHIHYCDTCGVLLIDEDLQKLNKCLDCTRGKQRRESPPRDSGRIPYAMLLQSRKTPDASSPGMAGGLKTTA
ncbi:MAG TPA: hypothetical protein VEK08_01600 [Planctomycetota bacterium]|nr:hypothetical protein [Planctomycetota bacterium]